MASTPGVSAILFDALAKVLIVLIGKILIAFDTGLIFPVTIVAGKH
jgi:hypothetical protein